MQAQRNIGSDQRGSVTILVAGAVLLAMVLLGAVQVGYVAYVKRDLQKMVDMAALSGIQQIELGNESGCAQATSVAQAIAQENLPGGQAQTVIRCGQWNEQTRVFTPRQGTQTANAIEVYASQEVSGVVPFVGAAEIDAVGVASRPAPLLVFSVGAKLLEFDNSGVLGGVLRGIGLDVPALTALSPQGIADARVSLRGLLGELLGQENADITLGDMQQLLTADLSLAQVLDASVRAAGQNQLVGIGAQVVSAVQASLQSGANPLLLRLGGDDGTGLFAGLTAQSAASALDAQIALSDLVGTAIAVASAGRGVTVNQQVGLGNLLNVTVQAGVIEPASIGIGGTGTTAYNAQVRTHARIEANVSVLGIIELALDLPITIDATRAITTVGRQAVTRGPVVEDWTCQADKMDAQGRSYANRAQLSTTVSALGICIGEQNPAALFSTQQSCGAGLAPANLLRLRIGGINTTVRRMVETNVLENNPPDVASYAVGEPPRSVWPTANPYPVGDVVDDLMSSVLALLLADNLNDATRPGLSSANVTQLATRLWDESVAQGTCNPAQGTDTQRLNCRSATYQKAAENIQQRVQGLGGFLSGLGNGVGAILQGVGTLNLSGVVSGLGSALTSVGNLVADIVGGLFTGLIGDSCAGRNIFGVPTGTPEGCKQKLQDILKEDSGYGQARVTNGLLVVLSETLSVLQGPLNQLGSMVLEPILKDIVGLDVVGADVTLLDLRNCAESQDVMLVR